MCQTVEKNVVCKEDNCNIWSFVFSVRGRQGVKLQDLLLLDNTKFEAWI